MVGGETHSRRHVLRLGVLSVGLVLFAEAKSAFAASASGSFPNGVQVLVAGTIGRPVDRWADVFLPILDQSLPRGTRIWKENAIGDDGVTGANQFAVRTTPDGATALLVPGAAVTAWLVGDSRVHFDIASWIPVMDGASPGVVVGRAPLSAFGSGQTLRVAAASPVGPELPILLALDLLGIRFSPVFGLDLSDQAERALEAGSADVILLHGENVPERMAALTSAGMRALFSFGAPDATGSWGRDPIVPDVPTFDEISVTLRGHPPRGPLAEVWRAAATATALEFALVLPELTPPALVALWRQAGAGVVNTATIRALAAAAGVSVEASPAANACVVAVNAPALLALRSWLDRRFGWRQS